MPEVSFPGSQFEQEQARGGCGIYALWSVFGSVSDSDGQSVRVYVKLRDQENILE
jgi:hypothetical protein